MCPTNQKESSSSTILLQHMPPKRRKTIQEGVDSMVDWAELNHDLLVLVAERIEKIEDFVSFASVCTSWRAAAAKNNFKGLRLWQGIPCLMLAMTGEGDVVRRFYSLLDDEIVAEVSLPYLKDKTCIQSLGWFLTSGQDGEHSLLNPFTGHEIPLPHQTTFPDYHSTEKDVYIFMEKMVLSARPDETSDYILMVMGGGNSGLAFWRPGDEKWTRIETQRADYRDVTFYNGKFYAIDAQGFVVVCNPAGSNPTKVQILARVVENRSASLNRILWYDEHLYFTDQYIVGSLDKLLIIIRTARQDRDEGLRFNTKKFEVFELDRRNRTWKRTEDLGNTAVFLGYYDTTALEVSKLPGIKGNHIYFFDDYRDVYYKEEGIGGKDIGIYNLKTGDIERFCPQGQLHSKICSSTWLVPKF